MPEGPEVKTFAKQLGKVIEWKTVSRINVLGGRFLKNPIENIDRAINGNIRAVASRGKFLYIDLNNGWYIWNTLGMTGHWGSTKENHSAIEIEFKDGDPVYFTDPRRFGTFKLVYDRKELNKKLFSFGYDFLNTSELSHWPDQMLMERSKKKLRSSKKTLAELLMDQSIFAGVGNYIKSESLFRARLSPWRTGESLTDADIGALLNAIGYIMSISYGEGGATLATYKHFDGSIGGFGKHLLVYKKDKVDDRPIKKEETLDKRSTYWVPTLQK